MNIRTPAGARPGSVRVAERVVAKIAAIAAAEVEDVAAPPPRLGRRGRLRRWPAASVKVVNGAVRVSLTLSVVYPAPVAATAEAVRNRVRERVAALAGLPVAHIDIEVPMLCGPAGAGVRAH
ncbi:hypothetical protein ACG83_07525 [Frankia sp. R43]|uniref:Asp23/Gls24 family envelope stress response protein n=1 Tax=Frankia sp. R43 TaxID=269536 RepID=UPI0006CA4454|nr:Asp23/Gls24 family envelope stress response protein [Frankia sp. R43]KPM57516.1 hypothetical protein ACG83_07525 [Frankia sp. R43]